MFRPPATAEQLHSVALRYRTAWGRPPAWGTGPRQGPGFDTPEDAAAPDRGRWVRPAALANLEAVLFLAREPLSTRKVAQLVGLADGTEARTLVRKLNGLYDAEGCAFRVEEVAGGLQLMSRPKFAPWLRRLHAVPVEIRLSAPALETLAVVVYRQPVLRAEVEAIRGVQCGEILRQLMERDLVRIGGRSKELGRPFLYGTTRLFLQVFGLRHLDELPRWEMFLGRPHGLVGREGTPIDLPRSDEEARQDTGEVSQDEEATVKTLLQRETCGPAQDPLRAQNGPAGDLTEPGQGAPRAYKDEDDEDKDLEDEEEDEEDEEEDEEDEDLDDDDDLEDDEWEEVEDDEEEDDLDEEDDEDEEDEEDEEDDEDWDDEEDWEDEEDEDWEDEDEGEGKSEGK